MAQLGTPDRPLRVAVVGAGPAGLYAAQGRPRVKACTVAGMMDVIRRGRE
jgi:threonine dehydrogenase-like Zn-dependent dehydrogenase